MSLRPPTREELYTIFKDTRLVIAIEGLFKQVISNLSPDELSIALGNIQANEIVLRSLIDEAIQKLDSIQFNQADFIEEEALNNSVLTWITVG